MNTLKITVAGILLACSINPFAAAQQRICTPNGCYTVYPTQSGPVETAVRNFVAGPTVRTYRVYTSAPQVRYVRTQSVRSGGLLSRLFPRLFSQSRVASRGYTTYRVQPRSTSSAYRSNGDGTFGTAFDPSVGKWVVPGSDGSLSRPAPSTTTVPMSSNTNPLCPCGLDCQCGPDCQCGNAKVTSIPTPVRYTSIPQPITVAVN